MAGSSNYFKTVIASLLRTAECPVCMETLKIPLRICSKGHGICSRCTERLEVCPTCQGTFVLENPVLVTNFIQALPNFCRHADNGCEVILEENDDHESVCGYRPIVCRKSYCKRIIPVINLLDHYKSEHPTRYICKEPYTTVLLPGFFSYKSNWDYLPVWLFGKLFWILTVNDINEECFKVFFQVIPIGRLEKDYYVQVKFEKEEFAYSFTLKASPVHNCTVKYSEDDPGSYMSAINGEDKYVFRIPQSEMNNFVSKGTLEFSLRFFEKAK